MITDLDSLIFMAVLIALAVFSLWLIKNRRKFLLPRIYLGVSASYSTWVLALLVMKYTPPEDTVRLFVLDAITNIGTTTRISVNTFFI